MGTNLLISPPPFKHQALHQKKMIISKLAGETNGNPLKF